MMKNLYLISFLFGMMLNAEPNKESTLPNLSFKLLDGSKISLDELLQDGPALIDFWATWCAPCKKEMIHLERFQQKYSKDGFKILAISTDTPRSMSKVKSYIRSKKYSFKVALDPNQQIAQKFNATLLPTAILINKNREIIWFHQGYIPGDEVEIEKQILAVLNNETTEDISE
jgi:thiol-disulfide isomerase/thioredoxin